MARRTPYASRNNDSYISSNVDTSSIDLSNYVEESELQNLLGTAASRDVITDVVASDDSLVTSSAIYNHLIDYVKWTSVENTLSDSSSLIPSSKTVLEHVSSTISGLNLGAASSRDVTNVIASSNSSLVPSSSIFSHLLDYVKWTSVEIGNTVSDSSSLLASSRSIRTYVANAIGALNLNTASTRGVTNNISVASTLLPTSGAVWSYLQAYTLRPTVYQGDQSGITVEWIDPGLYQYTFQFGLPNGAYCCSVDFERTFSYDGENGNASKVSYRLVNTSRIDLVLQDSSAPYARKNGRTSLIIYDIELKPVYAVFSGWSGILLQRTRVVY